MSAPRVRVATVAPGAAFLPSLVEGLRQGTLGLPPLGDRGDWSSATIFVPTRRAARALIHALVSNSAIRTTLLPRILPLGDAEDLEIRAVMAAGDPEARVPPAIDPLGRQLLLTALVEQLQRSEVFRSLAESADGFSIGTGFSDAFRMAEALAGLIDEFAIEGADWGAVKALAPDAFDAYWRFSRDFLAIAGTAWPQVLDGLGVVDAVERRNRLLRLEAERLLRERPTDPIIAAGSTGTVPATADLLSAIARMPNGVVVLPGLVTDMDERAWSMIPSDLVDIDEPMQPGHPQAGLKRLLQRMGCPLEEVRVIGNAAPSLSARARLVDASSRAADATDDWPDLRQRLAGDVGPGLADVAVVEAADEREEASAIAVALREVLETPEKTAALVTSDRGLARRVIAELQRWGVAADDSAGTLLAETSAGALARLLLVAVEEGFAPAVAMAALRAAALPDDDAGVAAIEIAGVRGVERAPGLAAFTARLDDAAERRSGKHASRHLRRLDEAALKRGQALLLAFGEAVAPLESANEQPAPLATFAAAHLRALTELAQGQHLAGPEGAALTRLLDRLAWVQPNPTVDFAAYRTVFEQLLARELAPPPQPAAGRIKIWGLLEARLIHADRLVLGSLNERTWPQEAAVDVFLNRGMRHALGLPQPERQIGQSALDFTMALGAPEVILARARTVEGTPTVASRFLRRLDAFVGVEESQALRKRGEVYLASARALDEASALPSAPRPQPRPPASLQPLALSVTEVSRLYRDPYAIYAKHVLGLQPLDPPGAPLDASDRGELIHGVLARFVRETADRWPDDPAAVLTAMGEAAFAPLMAEESVAAFWWPRFLGVVPWFVDWEATRRAEKQGLTSFCEVDLSLKWRLRSDEMFELRGRADRIDRSVSGDGGDHDVAVIDYKTGGAPSRDEVLSNLEPQLTLLAAMVGAGALPEIPSAKVAELLYVRVGGEPGEHPIKPGKDSPPLDEIAAGHLARFQDYIERLRSGDAGYLSRRMVQKQNDIGHYDHLARVQEWQSGGRGDD